MKKIITLMILFFTLLTLNPDASFARSYRTKASDVYVHGYTKKNGTYVQPHYRSSPDSSIWNNYSCIDYGKCGSSTSTPSYTTTTPTTPSYIPTYNYTAPSSSITNNCPINSYLSMDGSCYCNIGYKVNLNKTACVINSVINIQPAFLTIDPISNLADNINKPSYITGKTSANCSKIVVTARNFAEGVYDVYPLTKYSYGNTIFKYGIKKDWDNLGLGTTTYTITATCDNKQTITKVISVDFN